MPRNVQALSKFRRPELFLAEIVRKGIKGQYLESTDNVRILHRAVVVAVDVQGGMLENSVGAGGVTHVMQGQTVFVPAQTGPDNPANSVKARILTDTFDQFMDDDELRVYWPFFPEHQAIPVKPGEHVYVLFEDEDFSHGLWISKVSGQENVNYVSGQSSYTSGGQRLVGLFGGAQPQLQKTDSDNSGRRVKGKTALFGG